MTIRKVTTSRAASRQSLPGLVPEAGARGPARLDLAHAQGPREALDRRRRARGAHPGGRRLLSCRGHPRRAQVVRTRAHFFRGPRPDPREARLGRAQSSLPSSERVLEQASAPARWQAGAGTFPGNRGPAREDVLDILTGREAATPPRSARALRRRRRHGDLRPRPLGGTPGGAGHRPRRALLPRPRHRARARRPQPRPAGLRARCRPERARGRRARRHARGTGSLLALLRAPGDRRPRARTSGEFPIGVFKAASWTILFPTPAGWPTNRLRVSDRIASADGAAVSLMERDQLRRTSIARNRSCTSTSRAWRAPTARWCCAPRWSSIRPCATRACW